MNNISSSFWFYNKKKTWFLYVKIPPTHPTLLPHTAFCFTNWHFLYSMSLMIFFPTLHIIIGFNISRFFVICCIKLKVMIYQINLVGFFWSDKIRFSPYLADIFTGRFALFFSLLGKALPFPLFKVWCTLVQFIYK